MSSRPRTGRVNKTTDMADSTKNWLPLDTARRHMASQKLTTTYTASPGALPDLITLGTYWVHTAQYTFETAGSPVSNGQHYGKRRGRKEPFHSKARSNLSFSVESIASRAPPAAIR